MQTVKNIGLVAHDARKQEMLVWVKRHAAALCEHNLVCTGTTGKLISEMLATELPNVHPRMDILKSGPLGGDQQIGARIVEGKLDILVFLTDPMTTQPHDVDVKALVRLCTVYNVVLACTVSTADFVISSPFFALPYEAAHHDYSGYTQRKTV